MKVIKLLKRLFDSKEVDVRKAVKWKKDAEKMPEGVRKGLTKAILVSKACSRNYGTVVNPKSGKRETKKSICMKYLNR